MAIAYGSQGAGAGTETTGAQLALLCPTAVAANDILIAHVVKLDTSTTPTDPANWALLAGPYNVGTTSPTGRHWVYGKIADGTEDGSTVNFGTTGGTAGRYGRIYSFTGFSAGTIVQLTRAFTATTTDTDCTMPTVTTTVNGGLAVALVAMDDNNAIASATGESGGNWTEAVAEYVSTTIGAQGCMCQIQTCTPTGNPGTVSGGATATNDDEGGVIGFEIRPTVASLTGAIVFPITAGFVVSGTAPPQTRYGQIVQALTLGMMTVGKPGLRGQLALALNMAIVTAGSRSFSGQLALQLALDSATAARLTAKSAAVLPLVLERSTLSKLGARGAIVVPLTLTEVSAGRLGARSQIVLPLQLAALTNGSRTTRSAVVFPLALDTVATGRLGVRAVVVLIENLDVVTSGDISGAGADLYGAAVLPLTFGATVQGRRTTYAHPLTDAADGAWTTHLGGSNLAAQLDEEVIDDADYIRSELSPVDSACRMKLEPLVNPDHDSWHQIDWRIAKDAGAGNTVNMEIRLYQGGAVVLGAGTLVATFARADVSETFTTYHESLSAGQASAITNYADLWIEVEATVV